MRNPLKTQRNKDFRLVYESAKNSGAINLQLLNRDEIAEQLIFSQSPRFYITPVEASRRVNQYIRGKLPVKEPLALEMVKDLTETYYRIVNDKTMNLAFKYEVWEKVVTSPARRFYIDVWTAKSILFWNKQR